MKRLKPFLILSMLVFLGGCSSVAVGAALGSLATTVGSYTMTAFKDDTVQAGIWRQRHQSLVQDCQGELKNAIRSLDQGQFDKTMNMCNAMLEWSAEQQPRLLAERLGERVTRYKVRKEKIKAGAVIPKPVMVQPRPVELPSALEGSGAVSPPVDLLPVQPTN